MWLSWTKRAAVAGEMPVAAAVGTVLAVGTAAGGWTAAAGLGWDRDLPLALQDSKTVNRSRAAFFHLELVRLRATLPVRMYVYECGVAATVNELLHSET